MPRKLSTGCRPDELFGVWAMEAHAFAAMHEELQVVLSDQARYGEVLATSKAQNEDTAQGPAYELDERGIAKIAITGPITKHDTSFSSLFGGTSTLRTKAALREAMKSPQVKSVCLMCDSNGGTLLGCNELAEEINTLKNVKPIHAHVNGSCNSACYWLASQASSISAEATTEVGSVGGFAAVRDLSSNYDRQGIKVHVVANEGASKKGQLFPGAKVTDAQLEDLKQRVTDQTGYFQTAVKTARGLTDEQSAEVFKAGVYESKRAKDLGLVDDICSEEQALTKLASGHVFRGHVPAPPEPQPAASRSDAMPLTAEQLQRIQKLPGAASATDATAVDLVTKVAEESVAKLASVPQPPVKLTTEQITERVSLKEERLDLMVEKGNITKAQADNVKAMLKADPQGMLVSHTDGQKAPIDGMIAVFATGKTGKSAEEQTQEQRMEDVPSKGSAVNNSSDQADEKKMREDGEKQAKAYVEKRTAGFQTAAR